MATFSKKLLLGALISLLPMVLWANSYVFNTTDYDIDVVWIAAGCAGVKTSLGCGDLTDSGMQSLVCQKKTLAPGEGAGYAFKDGTSDRQVKALACGASTWSDTTNTANKGKKSRCSVKRGTGQFSKPINIKCNYSQSDFDALKSQ